MTETETLLPPPSLNRPDAICLIGDMTARPDGTQSIEGKWAQQEVVFKNPKGITNRFVAECGGPPADPLPRDGVYTGHFIITEVKKGSREVQDSSELRFLPNSAGGFNIEGTCTNFYGVFDVTGTMTPAGKVKMFRVLRPIGGAAAASAGAASGAAAAAGRRSGRDSAGSAGSFPSAVTPARGGKAPRESPGSSSHEPPAPREPLGGDGAAEHMIPQVPQAMTDDARERFRKVIDNIRKRPNSEWFFVAVDEELHVAKGYNTIVPKPMDLSLVLRKMDAGEYDTREEMYEDARLVFANAVAYNTNTTPEFAQYGNRDIAQAARDIKKSMNASIKKNEEAMHGVYWRPQPARHGGSSSSKSRRTSPGQPLSAAAAVGMHQHKAEALPPPPPPLPPAQLTREEQLELSKMLTEIIKTQRNDTERAHAYVVWKFIDEKVAAHLKKREGDEVVVDANSLSPANGHTLLGYCRHFLKQREAAAAAAAAGGGGEGGGGGGGGGSRKRPLSTSEEADDAAAAALAAAMGGSGSGSDSDEDEEEDGNEGGGKRHKQQQQQQNASNNTNDNSSSEDEAEFGEETAARSTAAAAAASYDDPKPIAVRGQGPKAGGAVARPTPRVAGAASSAAAEADEMEEDELAENSETAETDDTAPADVHHAAAAAWGTVEDSAKGASGGDVVSGGWTAARKEKADKEQRQREREEQERKLEEELKERQAQRAAELTQEAERQMKKRAEDERAARAAKEQRAKAEAAKLEEKKEEERAQRDAITQDVNLDEVRGDNELAGLMDDEAGF